MSTLHLPKKPQAPPAQLRGQGRRHKCGAADAGADSSGGLSSVWTALYRTPQPAARKENFPYSK